jgi:hypothetical protein
MELNCAPWVVDALAEVILTHFIVPSTVERLSPKFTHLESHCHWLLLISGRCEGLFLTSVMR